MTTPVVPDLIGAVIDDLLVAAETALSVPVGRVVHAPGTTPAFDDCCGGQLYARLVQVDPIQGQARSVAGAGCDIRGWQATIALGVVRCAAVLDEDGTPPTAEAVSADGLAASRDMSELAALVMCWEHTRTVVRWSPIAVQGGCHGGEWTLTVWVDTCGCQR